MPTNYNCNSWSASCVMLVWFWNYLSILFPDFLPKYFSHKRRNSVSPRGHVMFYLLYQQQWDTNQFYFRCERRHLLGSHNNGDLFTCEDKGWLPYDRRRSRIADRRSHVKISCFHAKAHLIFHCFFCFFYNKRFTTTVTTASSTTLDVVESLPTSLFTFFLINIRLSAEKGSR